MPSYEALFILKKLSKPETAKVLKRAATHIYDMRGILFGIENLGTRSLPHKMSKHGKPYREGSYFLMKFDIPPRALVKLKDEYMRDVDIINNGFVKVVPDKKFECTLDEELKPPAYREDVRKMIEDGRKIDIYKFKPKTGLDYNPFRT